jgi:L-ascorbate metabolism protein UlaG (beta-lactamase superfamily)
MIRFMYHAHHDRNMLVIFVLAFMITGFIIVDKNLAARRFRGTVSDHFDGARFFTPGVPKRLLRDAADETERKSVWLWLLSRRRGAWRQKTVPTTVPRERVHEGICVTYINHATVLLQFERINIITDPVFAKRASPFRFMGPMRFANAGVRIEDLPPIDVVLLSHNHYDHMDLASLRAIQEKWRPRIYTGLGNASYLALKGISGATEMDWWDVAGDGAISIHCVPAQHFSARSFSDRNKTLWCGFVLRTVAGDIYFAGDTGYGPFVDTIAARFGRFKLALIPIGAYEPAWMMQPVHVNPTEAINMYDVLKVETAVAIHHGTFRLTDESQDEPAARIAQERGERDFRVLENGSETLIR